MRLSTQYKCSHLTLNVIRFKYLQQHTTIMSPHNMEKGLLPTSMAPERSEVAKDWHARGYTCGLWIDHAARTFSGAVNDTEELLMVLSGKLELELQGSRVCPEIGEEILIPAKTQHTIKNIGGRTARWLYGQKLHPNDPSR